MKRLLLSAMLLGVARIAAAQSQNPVAPPPTMASVYMDENTHCQAVRAGDTVNYALTITDVASVPSVYAELQMRPGRRGGHVEWTRLPAPDPYALNGAGVAARDQKEENVYHISFVVPAATVPGIYHGVGVNVMLNDGTNRYVDVTRHTMEQVHAYCLAVFNGPGGTTPEVIEFKPGPIVRKP